MKDVVVMFHDSGARIFHGVDGREYEHVRHCLVNPAHPQGVPPHYWKISEGKIVEMSDSEKRERDELLLSLDETYHQRIVPISHPPESFSAKEYLFLALGSAGVGALIAEFFKLFFHH